MRQQRREATANGLNSPKVHRREGYLETVQIKPVIFSLTSCTSVDPVIFSPVIFTVVFIMLDLSETGEVTASPVMTKSWGPSWEKQSPGERPRETAET
jgi:hypothetical protein